MGISDSSSATVRSAEGVQFDMPAAGPAPRMLAYAIDATVLWSVLVVLVITVLLVSPALTAAVRDWMPAVSLERWTAHPEQVMLPFVIALMLLGYFAELLYFVFWEVVSGGSSLGKMIVGLRVVRLDGLKIDARASWIRNLMRLADVLPSSYVVGLVSMVMSPRGQRLGDLAAGTLVVRLDTPERALSQPFAGDMTPLPLLREQVERLGDTERTLIRTALRRAESLEGARRHTVLRTAADALVASLSLDPELAQDPEVFLRRLWATARRAS